MISKWEGMGKKEKNMYHYIEDKEFLKNMRNVCSNLVNQLVQRINNGNVMEVEAYMVGSGARNLETQNANNPIDLDYNIGIVKLYSYDINDCDKIKEYIKKEFNKVLNSNGWGDCKDSTSVLNTGFREFKSGNKTNFKIDLGIVVESDKTWYRLIHQKTGNTHTDKWIWNQGPNSKGVDDRVAWLKKNNLWNEVRVAYLKKKNMYLSRGDNNHPSFNCYIEAVNEVYDKYR